MFAFLSSIFAFVVKAVSVIGKALVQIASTGERIISTVKGAWKTVKPLLVKSAGKIIPIAKTVAKVFRFIKHPWAQAVATFIESSAKIIEKGIIALLALEKSPILRKVEKALNYFLPKMKDFGANLVSWAEVAEAIAIGRDLENLNAAPGSDEEKLVLLTKLISKFQILKSSVTLKINENDVKSMEEYLQLKATEKIFLKIQQRISKGLAIEDITADDTFVLSVAEKIIGKNPELTEREMEQFNLLIEKMFGKPILPLVFEEMVKFWGGILQKDIEERDSLKIEIAEKEVIQERYETNIKFGIELDEQEKDEFNIVKAVLTELKNKYKLISTSVLHRENYIYAAEGLQRSLEGEIEQVVGSKENAENIESQIPELSELLISVFREGVKWEDLEVGQQSLIRDFANIFRKASKKRAEELLTVEVEVS